MALSRSYRSPRRRRAVGVWLVLSTLAGGARAASGPLLQGEDAHGRMLAALREVERRARLDNPYLGEGLLREQRQRLEQLGPPPSAGEGPAQRLRRVQLLLAIGRLELQRGDEEQAIRDLSLSRELARGLPAQAAPELRLEVSYELAIAYLRRAETQNCVAHHAAQSCLFPIEGSGVHVEPQAARRASRLLVEVLELAEPGSSRARCARWHLNLAHMTLGEYPDGVPEAQLIPASAFASAVPFPRFPEVAVARGVSSFDLSGGVVVDDLNGDGRLDILTSTWDPAGPLHLYLAQASGGFEERGAAAGLEGLTGGLSLVQGDYDGDGDLDVLVLRGAWLGERGRQPNSLLENDGAGNFRDVTFDVGLGDAHYPTQAAAWGDYDGDGDLDLYVGNEATRELRYPSQLFQNDGQGHFEDVASSMGVVNLRYAKGVSFGDYDGDGRLDLYVSNLGARNRLYRNSGQRFVDVAEELGVEKPLDSFPAWFFDYDNDGVLDLYVTSYDQGGRSGNQGAFRLSAVVAEFTGERARAQRARLYRGDGQGGFEDVSRATGMARVSLTMGANFGDLDNDGFLDVYLGTGYPHNDGLVPNVMLRNDAGMRFVDVTTAGGFGHLQKGHGVAFADLDGDGDQDVYEQLGGAYPGDGYHNAWFENPGFGNTFVGIQLRGVRSNRFGLGARVRVDVGQGEARRSIHRSLPASGSFGGNPLELHVGLGSAERIERLEVHWPASGTRQVFEDLPVGLRLRITEGEEDWARVLETDGR